MIGVNTFACAILPVTLGLLSASAVAHGHREGALDFTADFVEPANCKPMDRDPHTFKKSCFFVVEYLHPILISLDENYYGYSSVLETGRVDLEVVAWRIGAIEDEIAMAGEGRTELAYTKRIPDRLPFNAPVSATTCIQYHREFENLNVYDQERIPFITRIDAMICAHPAEVAAGSDPVAHLVELAVQEVYSLAKDHTPIGNYDEIVRSVFASLRM